MKSSTKQVHRDLERAEQAHRRTLAENERLRHLLEVGGPLRGLAKAYADVSVAADPLRGRPLDRSSSGSEFDRPLPHTPTARYRAVKEAADRMMVNMTAALLDALGDQIDQAVLLADICDTCGQRIDERRRRTAIADARHLLEAVLADGPQEVSCVLRLAAQEGISQRTLDRATRGRGAPTIRKFQRGGRWWWELVEGSSR